MSDRFGKFRMLADFRSADFWRSTVFNWVTQFFQQFCFEVNIRSYIRHEASGILSYWSYIRYFFKYFIWWKEQEKYSSFNEFSPSIMTFRTGLCMLRFKTMINWKEKKNFFCCLLLKTAHAISRWTYSVKGRFAKIKQKSESS